MLVCRSCGSSRIRSGYQAPPLLLRLILMRTVLCDSCNLQFYAFSLRLPSSGRARRKSPRQSESFAPVASAVDLNRLDQAVAEVTPTAGGKHELGFELAAMIERAAKERIDPGRQMMEKEAEKFLKNENPEAEEKDVPPRQDNRPRCPRCQSVHTRRCHRNALERLVLSLSENRPFSCESCGRRFYARKPERKAAA
jgi:hypothetical protein